MRKEEKPKLYKILVVLFAVVLLASPARSGNIPEIDAVGCDALNFLTVADLVQHVPVIANNKGLLGPVNWSSDFLRERFKTTAGQLLPDLCFDGYL